jgi:hypothetical protein
MTVDPKTIPSISFSEQSHDAPAAQASAQGDAGSGNHSTAASHVWLLRLRALLFVTTCATFGVLLIIVPWTDKWTDNSLLLSMPELRPIVSNGFVRGLCSGLGILDLWLGFWEAIYYHEKPMAGSQ